MSSQGRESTGSEKKALRSPDFASQRDCSSQTTSYVGQAVLVVLVLESGYAEQCCFENVDGTGLLSRRDE